MQLTTRQKADVVIADLDGRWAAGDGAGVLQKEVSGLLGAGSLKIVLNMASVSYLDSTGLGELVAMHRAAGSAGAKIKLAQVGTQPLRIIQLAGLTGVLDIRDSEADAIASFGR